jgi:hypothetical protein
VLRYEDVSIAREESSFAETDSNISCSSSHVSYAEELTSPVDSGNTPRFAADPLLNFLDLIL